MDGGDRNIDQRIEALTMNLELLASDVHDLQSVVRDLANFTKDVAVGTARLLMAVEAHEQRISNLEEGNR
jgi:hypothetical protein